MENIRKNTISVPNIPNCDEILAGLEQQLPVNILESIEISLNNDDTGAMIVDEVNGFCTAGAGNLAPPASDEAINQMIQTTNYHAGVYVINRRPILVFCDTHEPGKLEPPYPPHCERGSGEEKLVENLDWLEHNDFRDIVTIIEKDCINGFIGGITPIGNSVQDWFEFNMIKRVIAMGICTDICDLQLIQTILSARNHGLLGELKEVIVLVPACATYDLPLTVVNQIGLPDTAAHPRAITQHIGLYLMQSSGAILTNKIVYTK